MPEPRTVIAEVPSGKIELVLLNDRFLVVQFNCACMDALPYCKAICCRPRTGQEVILTAEEAQRFHSMPHPTRTGEMTLAQDPETNSCIYLENQTCLCKTHPDKPSTCQNWHCSPGGVGEGILYRDLGWVLRPVMGIHSRKESDLVQDIGKAPAS